MILNQIHFFSETLGMLSSMYTLMPQRMLAERKSKHASRIRTLYLLHGHSDDHTAWQRYTSIERYAEELNLAVVMPAVHLSFYNDMAHGLKYWQFISEEVPAVVRDLFSLSAARGDNYVAGLSMGGYGAFKLALTHPERFAAAASLSGALDIREVVDPYGRHGNKAWREEMRTVFGDVSKVPNSKHDLFTLTKRASRAPVKPRLFACCGTEDELHPANLRFLEVVQKLPLDLTYEEGPGKHNWEYWDRMIQRTLEWMFPIKKRS